MSRRHILNITSEKKQDTMISLSAISPIVVGGYVGPSAHLLFCPTYRNRTSDDSGFNEDPGAGRTAQHTYAKGIREKIFFTSSGGSPLRWRRIIFSTKSRLDGVDPNKYQFSSGAGVRSRPMLPLDGTSIANLQLAIFQGKPATDYIGSLDGKVDLDMIKVHKDMNMVVNPGNATGNTKVMNFYTPLEKNLTYADTEVGNEDASSPYSEFSAKGLGNVFIYDIFETVVTTSPESQIQFLPNTTYYWHEK